MAGERLGIDGHAIPDRPRSLLDQNVTGDAMRPSARRAPATPSNRHAVRHPTSGRFVKAPRTRKRSR